LENKVFDITDARCNHEVYRRLVSTLFLKSSLFANLMTLIPYIFSQSMYQAINAPNNTQVMIGIKHLHVSATVCQSNTLNLVLHRPHWND